MCKLCVSRNISEKLQMSAPRKNQYILHGLLCTNGNGHLIIPLTGYIRGGCSPVGMKKLFPTFIDASALAQTTIMVSGGKIGTQVELEPQALANLIGAQFADIAGDAQ